MRKALRAHGATLPEAFASAALAVLAQSFDPGAVAERDVREVRAHGRTIEALLASWINECIYVLEVEGFAWRRIEFAVFEASPREGGEPMRLHAFLHGEELAPDHERVDGTVELALGSIEIRAAEVGYDVVLETGSEP